MALTNFYRATTKAFTGQIEFNGSYPDITGDQVTIYMAQSGGDDTIEVDADVSAGSGNYSIEISKTISDVAPDKYYYEIWWTRSTGKTYLLEAGIVEILKSKTR